VAHIYATFRCEPSCARCQSCHPQRWPECTPDELRTVLGRLRGLDVIKMLGGDPFAREDIDDVVRTVKAEVRPYIFQLNTTGDHPERVLEVVSNHGWPRLHLRVSMEGWRIGHDARRSPGSFSRMRRTVEGLAALRGRVDFSLGVNYHVHDASLRDLWRARLWCQSLGVGFFPGIPVKPVLFREEPHTLARTGLPLTDLDAYRRQADGRRRPGGYRVLEALFLGRTDAQLLDRLVAEGPNLRFDCQELRSLAYVLPNGDVVACGLRTQTVGNLREQTLEHIWRSPQAAAARRGVDSCMGCYQASVQLMSRLYGGRP